MATNSKFFSNIKFWIFVVPIIMITVFPMVNLEWFYTIDPGEIELNAKIFGKEKHDQVQLETDEQFAKWFISSGIYANTTKADRTNGSDLQVAHATDAFVNEYFQHLWKMVYRALYRLHVAWQWFIGAIILIGAAIYDGWQQRKIKRHIFGYSNPLAFHLVTHALFTLIGSVIALFFFPLVLSPLTWLVGTAVLAVLGWKMAESFQTGS